MGRPQRQAKVNRLAKSVLSRLAPLTQDQRVDYTLLVARGIPLAEARAIAQGYHVEKQAVDKSGDNEATQAYYQAFHKASRRLLPDWQHDMLHRSARGKAGSEGLKKARMRADSHRADLIDEMDMLSQRLKECQASLTFTPSEVRKAGNFKEEDHPRADNGEFGSGGSAAPSSKPAATKSPRMAKPKFTTTQSGKPVDPKADEDSYRSYSSQDYHDAAAQHAAAVGYHEAKGNWQKAMQHEIRAKQMAHYGEIEARYEKKMEAAAEAQSRAPKLPAKQDEALQFFIANNFSHADDASHLEDAIADNKLSQATTLHRGMTLDPADIPKVGATIGGRGVQSFSDDLNTAQSFALENRRDGKKSVIITAEMPKGAHALSTAKYYPPAGGLAPDEGEHLLSSKQKFRVKSLEPRSENGLAFTHIVVEPIPSGGVKKSAPGTSEVHVMVPMGSQRPSKGASGKRKRPRRAKDWISKQASALGLSQRELSYVQAAYGLQVPTESNSPDGDVHPATEGLMEANRLVAGMDAEMMAGAPNADEARARASRRLRERPGSYDAVGPPSEVRGLSGLLLDIGSGMARQPGWLGLDIFAYDYGTVLHDVEMGLPFPDGSVRGIRLVHALHPILDAPMANPDPVPLLTECQRVLMEGGCLYYEGPEPLVEDDQRWPLPGLILSYADDAAHETRPRPDGTYAQVLKRVPLRVPAYHGALADFSPAGPMPLELQMALAAYNAAPADRAMANLIHKADVHTPGQASGRAPRAVREAVAKALGDGKRVAITKADAHKRIAYGIVLEPDTEDTQGDVISAEEIEKSAHQWMSTSRIIGLEHGEPIDAMPVESFICPMNMTFDGPQGRVEWPQGAWVMGVKFMDPAHFQMALDGEITGFSVGGLGLRE